MNLQNQIAIFLISGILCLGFFFASEAFAQKSDSIAASIRARKINRPPQIKVDLAPYKSKYYLGRIRYNEDIRGDQNDGLASYSEKILAILKIHPNPVDDKISVTFRLNRDSNLSVKILDLLGNEVVTLTNGQFSEGEQTKTFVIPSRLNTGIYFLKITAGSENVVKRISVL